MPVFAAFRLLLAVDFAWVLFWFFMPSPVAEAQASLNRAAGYQLAGLEANLAGTFITALPYWAIPLAECAALILLALFAPAGRYLFLVVVALYVGMIPAGGYDILHPYESVLVSLTDMTVGAIVAMMFTGPVGEGFNRRSPPATAVVAAPVGTSP